MRIAEFGGDQVCRGCGADLSTVLAVVEGKAPAGLQLAKKEVDLSSRALRGLIGGMGFLIMAGIGFGLSTRTWVTGFWDLCSRSIWLIRLGPSQGGEACLDVRMLPTIRRRVSG